MKSKLIIALAIFGIYSNGVAQKQTEGQETKERVFQVSVTPGFGTSRGPKEGYTNNFSLNIFAGYEHSLNGFELGAFYNGDKHSIKGGQIAGFANTVGGSVSGLQAAGFVNTAKLKVTGAQAAGFANVTTDDVTGAQVSGFSNTAKNTNGAQITGFGNVATGYLTGAQVAGLGNVATGKVTGAQVSGLGNVAAKSVTGTQVAGLFNYSQDIKGAQISGLVNKAKNVKGVQIGLINIADTVESGVVIGLINIVKTGKHQFAVEHNDVMDLNVAFRSGTNSLYTVLFAGIEAKEDYLWSYGVGLGSQFSFKNKWNGSIELTSQTINPKEDHHETLNLLNRFSLNVGYQLAKHLSISGGPALNIYVTEVYNSETGKYGNDIHNGTFYNETFSGTNVKMWIGYNLSIKF